EQLRPAGLAADEQDHVVSADRHARPRSLRSSARHREVAVTDREAQIRRAAPRDLERERGIETAGGIGVEQPRDRSLDDPHEREMTSRTPVDPCQPDAGTTHDLLTADAHDIRYCIASVGSLNS